MPAGPGADTSAQHRLKSRLSEPPGRGAIKRVAEKPPSPTAGCGAEGRWVRFFLPCKRKERETPDCLPSRSSPSTSIQLICCGEKSPSEGP